MSNYNLDSTDLRILKYLVRDARTKVVDIAGFIGVTSAAIHQRLAKIKKAGYIKGYTADLDEKALGYKTCAFVGVHMDRNSHYRDVLEKLKRIEEVVEAHYTTGKYALFVKLYAKDNDHLMQILNGEIQNIKGITQTETFISLESPIKRSIPLK